MVPKVLIIEELHEKRYESFNGYVNWCIVLGYPYQVCHDRRELPSILQTFSPDIAFWIHYYREKNPDIDYYDQMRQQYKNLKVVLAYDIHGRMADMGDIADIILPHSYMIDPEEFQNIISELVLTNLYDKSSMVKWVKFDLIDELSENALRAIAAERMWPGKKSSLEWFIEQKNEGEKLTEKSQQHLAQLMQSETLLRQRKAKAVEILIERGVTESIDELMNPKNGIPNFGPMEK